MKVIDKPMKTRVFRAGYSQAIRIPKALELPEGHVLIEPRDGGLFISTLRGRWDLFFFRARRRATLHRQGVAASRAGAGTSI